MGGGGEKSLPSAVVLVIACVLESARSALVAHYYLLTVAALNSSADGSIQRCAVYEESTLARRNACLDTLTDQGYIRTAVDFATILQDIDDCSQATPGKIDSKKNGISVFRIIKPGTRWCGAGNHADSFDHLGTETKIDRCCRAHDFCPVSLARKTRAYGIYNFNGFTVSHCDCDLSFRNCLKKVGTEAADQTGKTLFDVLKAPCVQFRSGTNSTGGCGLDDYDCQVANIILVRENPVSYKNSRWIWHGYYHVALNF